MESYLNNVKTTSLRFRMSARRNQNTKVHDHVTWELVNENGERSKAYFEHDSTFIKNPVEIYEKCNYKKNCFNATKDSIT